MYELAVCSTVELGRYIDILLISWKISIIDNYNLYQIAKVEPIFQYIELATRMRGNSMACPPVPSICTTSLCTREDLSNWPWPDPKVSVYKVIGRAWGDLGAKFAANVQV